MKSLDVGANVFIGNLDPEIDEKLLYDIFSAFGVILQTPKVSYNYRIARKFGGDLNLAFWRSGSRSSILNSLTLITGH